MTITEEELITECENIIQLYEEEDIDKLTNQAKNDYMKNKKTLELIKELKEYRNKENTNDIDFDYQNGYIAGVDDFSGWFLNNYEYYAANNVHKTFRDVLIDLVSLYKKKYIAYKFNIGDWVECENKYEPQLLKSIFLGEESGFYWILDPKSKTPISLNKAVWAVCKIKDAKIDFDGVLEVVK